MIIKSGSLKSNLIR